MGSAVRLTFVSHRAHCWNNFTLIQLAFFSSESNCENFPYNHLTLVSNLYVSYVSARSCCIRFPQKDQLTLSDFIWTDMVWAISTEMSIFKSVLIKSVQIRFAQFKVRKIFRRKSSNFFTVHFEYSRYVAMLSCFFSRVIDLAKFQLCSSLF
jgi:hypothetical protein